MVRFPVNSSRRPLFRRSGHLAALVALVAALGLTSALAAAGEPHPFELTAFGGYRAGGRFEVEPGRLVLAEGVSFGASLGYHASPDMIVDFTYTRQSTDLEFRPADSGEAIPVSDILIQGFYLGGLYEHGFAGSRPFVGVGLGANRLDPEVPAVDSQTRFSFNFSGGLRTDISRQVGLKFTLRGTFSTPPDDGSTIVCQTPAFCYVQAGNSLVSQFDFSVGLAIRP